jgi:Family of unknown function (DUF6600)/FecR protein
MTLPSRSSDAFQYGQSIIAVAFVALLAPTLAWAQDAAQNAPAHLSAVDGMAAIDREGETINAVAGEVVLEGDRLRTESGRAELWFPDGSILDVDERSVVELQSESLVRLTSGRILLTLGRTSSSLSSTPYQVDTPAGTITPSGPGEYRVAVSGVPGDEAVELQVIRGAAQLIADGGSLLVRSGQQSFARINSAPSRTEFFNSARYDAFDRWIAAQRDVTRGRAVSTQYLPPDLRMYGGTFDQYGSWNYEPAYGYVWYPTVAATWRPYYHGYWRPVPRYGWTWIGADVWGWPTHHYGRWGYNRARWFWIPGARLASTTVQSLGSRSRLATRGAVGRSCRARTSAFKRHMSTVTLSTVGACRATRLLRSTLRRHSSPPSEARTMVSSGYGLTVRTVEALRGRAWRSLAIHKSERTTAQTPGAARPV